MGLGLIKVMLWMFWYLFMQWQLHLFFLNLLLHDIDTLGTGFREDKQNLMGLWDQASHSGRCWGWNVTLWSLIEHNNSIIEKRHEFNEQEPFFRSSFNHRLEHTARDGLWLETQ